MEEFISDQVVELDKMEASMKQTVANKKTIEDDLRDITKSKSILENEYQKVKGVYEQTKVKWYASVCTCIHKQALELWDVILAALIYIIIRKLVFDCRIEHHTCTNIYVYKLLSMHTYMLWHN